MTGESENEVRKWLRRADGGSGKRREDQAGESAEAKTGTGQRKAEPRAKGRPRIGKLLVQLDEEVGERCW